MGGAYITHEKWNSYMIFVGKPGKNLDVGGSIILKWNLNWMGWYGLNSSGSG
jgi:hypothetical protein